MPLNSASHTPSSETDVQLANFLEDYHPDPISIADLVEIELALRYPENVGSQLHTVSREIAESVVRIQKSGQEIEGIDIQGSSAVSAIRDELIRQLSAKDQKSCNGAEVLPKDGMRVRVQRYVKGAVIVGPINGGPTMTLFTNKPGQFQAGQEIVVKPTSQLDKHRREIVELN